MHGRHPLCPLLSSLLITCIAALAMAPAALAQDDYDEPAAERAIFRAFENADYDRAAELIGAWLEHHPDDPTMLYNLACAHCQGGAFEDAKDALFASVKAGFIDFEHMQTDPDLEAIRGSKVFKAIVDASRRVAGRRAEGALARWKRKYGEEQYRYEIDEERKLAFATALDDVSHREMREMLEREADHLHQALFGGPPDYYVLIAVPLPDHANDLMGDPNIGGRYEHGSRRIVARDIGGTLRHEFVHALHYGHMERLGLTTAHPIWVQEGMAALYEDYDLGADGTIDYLPNERSNIVKNMVRRGRAMKWERFFTLSGDRFMARSGQMYPQARSVFEFLADRGKLSEWYRVFVETFADDPSGIQAFETVFGEPLEDVESDWRDWVRRRPTVDHRISPGDASLGIEADLNGSNDGVVITRVMPGSAAGRALLRTGDVIVAADGQPTRTMMELRKVIGAKKVGDRIPVRVRRRGSYLTVTVILRPLRT